MINKNNKSLPLKPTTMTPLGIKVSPSSIVNNHNKSMVVGVATSSEIAVIWHEIINHSTI